MVKNSNSEEYLPEDLASCIAELKNDRLYQSAAERIENFLKFDYETQIAALDEIDITGVFIYDIPSRIEKGEIIADFTRLKVQESFLRNRFSEFFKMLAGENNQTIESLIPAIQSGEINFSLLQSALVNRGDYISILQREYGIEPLLLISLFVNIYRPIFEAALELSGKTFDLSQWKKGWCPVCGTFPCMSRLDKDTGKRYLWCIRCNSEWLFKRLKCPFCGEEDTKNLDYFYLEDGSPYRVDVCRSCSAYLKTIDEKKVELRKVLFLLEDIKTSYLDLLAVKEGFNKKVKGYEQ
jgi:FdhE protein